MSANTPELPRSVPRGVILAALVCAYVVVSVVAYTDYPPRTPQEPLTELERRGLTTWRRHNCQACHQLYGFGGFIGPDLTNRITDDTSDDELGWILESGSGRMPALSLRPAEQEAVFAFLRGVNRTGQSQPNPLAARRAVDVGDESAWLTEAYVRGDDRALEPAERRGHELWEQNGCGSCHVAFTAGRNLAPDLSVRAVARSSTALDTLLVAGRGRMPAYELAPNQIDDLSAYLEWFAAHRSELRELHDRMRDPQRFSWSGVPWFEYR